MSDLKFANTQNLVAFLEKPTESEGYYEIVDFLNANSIKYALTVNPTIYCSCIKQFWDTVKAKTVNGEVQLQALVDKKKVIITESTIRRDLQLEDAEETECLPTTTIFEELTRIGGKRKVFMEELPYLFQTMMVQAHKEMGEGSKIPTDPHHTPIIQPSTSQPQKKQSRRKQRKDTEIPQYSGPIEHIADEVANEEHVPTQSNDLPLSRVNTLGSGEDRLSLKELMDLYTKLSDRVLGLETTKTAHAKEIASLKKRVKKLERKRKSKPPGMKRLFKIGRSAQVVSSKDEEVTLIDETQGRNDDNLMFDTGVLDEQEVEVEKVVSTAKVAIDSATTTVDELTLAQTLIEIKAAKPKVRGVMIQEPSEFTTITTTTTPVASKPSQDKGKAKMTKSEKPLKKKDQDNTQAMMDADRLLDERFHDKVNMFVDIDTELARESSKKDEAEMAQESSSKRACDELEQEKAKKQKIDDEQEEVKLKEIMEINKEGKISIYQIIRADGSSKRYSAVIHMLKNFNREDLETLWKIVKARHGYTRPEEGYERVLWGDLKTVFEHHVEDLGRIVGIIRLRDDLRVIAAQLVLLVQSYNCLLRVNDAATKLQLLKYYNCSRIKTAEKIKVD
ncbi:hypothetical protein Tco_1041987 [Tanacetum coccineum]|uniref:Xylulose kinase-1 n=1 Tax=Tanacetum coccineum TaxID=301880 RepID=A0ABQ5GK40_9ASTR